MFPFEDEHCTLQANVNVLHNHLEELSFFNLKTLVVNNFLRHFTLNLFKSPLRFPRQKVRLLKDAR